MPAPDVREPRRGPQFSLRWLVVAVLLLGPTLGLGGPIAVRFLQEITAPPPPPIVIPAAAFDASPPGYYESGETPLD